MTIIAIGLAAGIGMFVLALLSCALLAVAYRAARSATRHSGGFRGYGPTRESWSGLEHHVTFKVSGVDKNLGETSWAIRAVDDAAARQEAERLGLSVTTVERLA